MAFFGNNTGKTPTGEEVSIPVSGIAAYTTIPLEANESWSSPILEYNGNDAVHFSTASDVGGQYTVLYYMNGEQIGFMGNPTNYDPERVNSFQGALSGKADAIQITYKNGSAAQTRFYFEIRFATTIQETLRSIGVPVSSTNMGSATHAVIEARKDDGSYEQVTVSEAGDKAAMDVYVVNQPQGSEAVDTSDLAKDNTLTNGNQRTVLVNGNNQIYGSQGNPLNVAVTNQPNIQQVSVNNLPATQPISGNVGITGNVSVGNFPATQPVSISSQPLPTGASTSALQTAGNTSLGSPSDAAVVDPTSNGSIIALLKGLLQETVSAGTSGTFTAISLVANVGQSIAANPNRKMVIISSVTGTILIGVGFTATSTNWSYRAVTNATVEIPTTGAPLLISFFATSNSTVNVTQIS